MKERKSQLGFPQLSQPVLQRGAMNSGFLFHVKSELLKKYKYIEGLLKHLDTVYIWMSISLPHPIPSNPTFRTRVLHPSDTELFLDWPNQIFGFWIFWEGFNPVKRQPGKIV